MQEQISAAGPRQSWEGHTSQVQERRQPEHFTPDFHPHEELGLYGVLREPRPGWEVRKQGKGGLGPFTQGLVQLAKLLRAKLSSSGVCSETWAAGSILAAETRHRASRALGSPGAH